MVAEEVVLAYVLRRAEADVLKPEGVCHHAHVLDAIRPARARDLVYGSIETRRASGWNEDERPGLRAGFPHECFLLGPDSDPECSQVE